MGDCFEALTGTGDLGVDGPVKNQVPIVQSVLGSGEWNLSRSILLKDLGNVCWFRGQGKDFRRIRARHTLCAHSGILVRRVGTYLVSYGNRCELLRKDDNRNWKAETIERWCRRYFGIPNLWSGRLA
jgi:hypothetical protein